MITDLSKVSGLFVVGEMFEEVTQLDPEFGGGYVGLSIMLSISAVFSHIRTNEVLEWTVETARRAIAVDRTFGWSDTSPGMALLNQYKYQESIEAFEIAIQCQPIDAAAHAYFGLVLSLDGLDNWCAG